MKTKFKYGDEVRIVSKHLDGFYDGFYKNSEWVVIGYFKKGIDEGDFIYKLKHQKTKEEKCVKESDLEIILPDE